MNSRIEEGRNGDFWIDQLPDGISLVRKFDKFILIAALISFIATFICVIYVGHQPDATRYNIMPFLLAFPFFVCGLIFFTRSKAWILIIIAIAATILWFCDILPTFIFFPLFLIIGASGVVTLVDALQRAVFYKVLHSIEYINVKKDPSFTDKIIAFLFNVPGDLDTRNITMDYELNRTKIPWKEVANTVYMGLMVGMFIWIYISMNPNFMNLAVERSIPLMMFTLILYIPVLVMPWSIFRSLNVRVETNYRNFKIYNGIKATLQRMAIPIVAALLFVLMAINKSDVFTVLWYILFSAAMIVVVLVSTSLLYHWRFESITINDIISKWRLFRPASVFVGLNKNGKKGWDDVPGTPERDKTDFGKLTLPEER